MSIWETLSKIDCNAHVEKKGRFSYLSWTWAWAMVKERYPLAHYTLEPDITYPDGTMEVRCTVAIDELSHTMWLPVINSNNKAIANPNAFDVNSSRMRCLVKCLAMFGLGHYIYAGESVPQHGDNEAAADAPAMITDEQAANIKARLAATKSDVKAFCSALKIENVDAMPANAYALADVMISKKEARA